MSLRPSDSSKWWFHHFQIILLRFSKWSIRSSSKVMFIDLENQILSILKYSGVVFVVFDELSTIVIWLSSEWRWKLFVICKLILSLTLYETLFYGYCYSLLLFFLHFKFENSVYIPLLVCRLRTKAWTQWRCHVTSNFDGLAKFRLQTAPAQCPSLHLHAF